MKKFLKITLALMILILIGIGVFWLTFDLNTYRGMVIQKLSIALGRPVEIGSLEMKLAAIPTIRIQDITVGNPEGFDDEEAFAKVDSAEVTLALAPLLSKRLEVQNIALMTGYVNLIEKNGKNNWTFDSDNPRAVAARAVQGANTDAEEWLKQMRIDTVSLKKLLLSHQVKDKKQSFLLNDFSLKQLKVFSFSTTMNNQSFKVAGNLDSLLDLLRHQQDYKFNIDITAANAAVKLLGNIGDTTKFTNLLLNVDITGQNIKQTLSDFGIAVAGLPAQPFVLKAVLQGDLTAIQLSSFSLTLGGDKMTLSGTGKIAGLQENPSITFNGSLNLSDRVLAQALKTKPFRSTFKIATKGRVIDLTEWTLQANRSDIQGVGRFDFSAAVPAVQLALQSEYFEIEDLVFTESQPYRARVATANQVPKRLISDKTFDLSALNKVNADVKLAFPHIKISDAISDYVGVMGNVSLKKGVFSTNQLAITALGGQIATNAHLDTTQPQYRFDVQLDAQQLNMNVIKKWSEYVQGGHLDANVKLSATGRSIYRILSTLNGQIVAELSEGTIVNPWFNNLAAPFIKMQKKKNSVSFSTTDQESRIVCGAVNLTVRNGVIQSNEDIALETSTVNFLIGGEVDVFNETLNLQMHPFVGNSTIEALAQVVQIGGTFQNPVPGVAQEAVAPQLLQLGLNKLTKQKNTRSELNEYALCQKVLKHKTKGQLRTEQKKRQVLPLPAKPEPVEETTTKTLKDEFQQQLLKSLREALQ